DLLDIVDDGRTLCRKRCYQQGDPRSDIRRNHRSGLQLRLEVVTDDSGPVRVAKDDLGSHVDQLIHEKESTFEHLLVDQYASPSLGSHNQHDAQQVRSESWPGGIADVHDGTIDEILYLISVLMRGNEDVIPSLFNGNA